MVQKNILLLVEDPGSANICFDLKKKLKKKKLNCDILAKGSSKQYLDTYNQSFFDFEVSEIQKSYDMIICGTSENRKSKINKLFNNFLKDDLLTCLIIDAPNSIEERLKCFDGIPNYFFVFDNDTKTNLEKKGFKKTKIINLLNPKFEWIINKKKKKKKNNIKKKILFCTELSTGLNEKKFIKNNEYLMKGYSKSKKRTEIVFEEFLTSLKNFKDQYELILRLHPKEKISSYTKYRKYIDIISVNENPFKLLNNMDLVVGLTSNFLCESRLFGIPTLSVTPLSKEFLWINSDFRKYLVNVNTLNQLNLYMEDFFLNKITVKNIYFYKKKVDNCIEFILKKNV